MDLVEEKLTSAMKNEKAFFNIIYNSLPDQKHEIIRYRYRKNGTVYSSRKETAKLFLYDSIFDKLKYASNEKEENKYLALLDKYENEETRENEILKIEKCLLSSINKAKKADFISDFREQDIEVPENCSSNPDEIFVLLEKNNYQPSEEQLQKFYSHIEQYAKAKYVRKVYYYTFDFQSDEQKQIAASLISLEDSNVITVALTKEVQIIFDQCITHKKLKGKLLPSYYVCQMFSEGDDDLREIQQSRPFKYSVLSSKENQGIPSFSFSMLMETEKWR